MPFRQLFQAREVREPRRADVAAVRPVGAVRDQVDAKLALGRLNGGVCLAGSGRVAFGVQLEVVDQRLHVLFHLLARRRGHLLVVDANGTWLEEVEALDDDANRLAHLLEAHEVAVVAVALGAHWHLELELGVDLVRLCPPKVPRDSGAAEHDATEAVVESVLSGDHSDIDKALLPDAVAGEQFLDLVEAPWERLSPRVDVLAQPERQVGRHATRPDVCCVHARAGYALIELHELFTLLEADEEGRCRANIEALPAHVANMIEDARDLEEHDADDRRPPWYLNVQQLFDCK
mmetsp:Transcript_50842/g.132162  ORF Transcript_50842/g.132162 Transcript_50842/m.132162 type:complete len:291 (-) Transcript_50842:410-1282(-)